MLGPLLVSLLHHTKGQFINKVTNTFFQLALTAGSPIYRGYLSDVDCRWDVIAASLDDRTPGERGLEVILIDSAFALPANWRA